MVPGSFPPKYAAGYLNTKEVQFDLGVPLNFSGLSTAVATGMFCCSPMHNSSLFPLIWETILAFTQTGDFVIGKNLEILGKLLDKGVKVALVYGDSDYQCNCE